MENPCYCYFRYCPGDDEHDAFIRWITMNTPKNVPIMWGSGTPSFVNAPHAEDAEPNGEPFSEKTKSLYSHHVVGVSIQLHQAALAYAEALHEALKR